MNSASDVMEEPTEKRISMVGIVKIPPNTIATKNRLIHELQSVLHSYSQESHFEGFGSYLNAPRQNAYVSHFIAYIRANCPEFLKRENFDEMLNAYQEQYSDQTPPEEKLLQQECQIVNGYLGRAFSDACTLRGIDSQASLGK